jgi:hypothetical protein
MHAYTHTQVLEVWASGQEWSKVVDMCSKVNSIPLNNTKKEKKEVAQPA